MIRILATADGSPESMAVIPILEKLASNLDAQVQLLTVVERPKGTQRRQISLPRSSFAGAFGGGTLMVQEPERPQWAETGEQALDRAIGEGRDFLESIAKPLMDKGFAVKLDVLVDANIAKAIIGYDRENKVDLIAMATHGRGGLSDLLQGSVASTVLRSGVAPVLLTRPSRTQVKAYRTRAVSGGPGLKLPAT
jgi:nucleotide-binding universal stress UspA family protein